MRKTAEHATTDGGKFPVESCRERLARKWGLDAVALSGPCEGRPLCECVCEQLDSRWDKLKDRFAGKDEKVVKLASKLAESYMRKDDFKQCESDLAKIGFDKAAASGIAGYLKAYAMEDEADAEVEDLTKEVESEEAPAADAMETPMDESLEDHAEPEGDMEGLGEEAEEPVGLGDEEAPDLDSVEEQLPDLEAPAEEPPMEEGLGEPAGETVVIEIPKEVAMELDEYLDKALGEHEEPGAELGEGLGDGIELDKGMPELPMEEDTTDEPLASLDNVGVEIVTEIPAETEPEVDEVPGKPESPLQDDKQFAVGDEKQMPEIEEGCSGACGKPEVEKSCGPSCGKKASEGQEEDVCPHCGHKSEPKKTEPKAEKEPAKKEENTYSKAAQNMKSGHLNSVKFSWLNKFADEQMLRLGPEMSINNTDQLSKGRPMGNAKEKAVEAPKPLSEGNVHPDGFTAGGNKFQDGKTMGREERFDAATINKSDVSKGSASLMGKNESIPKDGPSVPSQETPLMTKGTVIATIRPDGILVEANGKKFLAKHPIAKPTQALASAIEAIPFDGDGKKFAQEALRIVRQAEEQPKTDSGKHEGTVTNGPETPKEGKAPKGGKGKAKDGEGITKIPTAKQEGDNFQNDPKKPTTKKAEKIEEPKSLPEGNVKPEGHSAGGTKFQDGGTMGNEQKFNPEEVKKSEVSKGDASRMGNEPALDLQKFDIPKAPDKGRLGNEELEGGDRSTKGTVIAEIDEQKRKAEDAVAASKVKEARLKAASVLVADMLSNDEITKAQYSEHLERYSALPVPAIQALANSLTSQREKIAKKAEASAQARAPGMSLPVVVQSSSSEKSLKDKLIGFSALTKKCDSYDQMRAKEK